MQPVGGWRLKEGLRSRLMPDGVGRAPCGFQLSLSFQLSGQKKRSDITPDRGGHRAGVHRHVQVLLVHKLHQTVLRVWCVGGKLQLLHRPCRWADLALRRHDKYQGVVDVSQSPSAVWHSESDTYLPVHLLVAYHAVWMFVLASSPKMDRGACRQQQTQTHKITCKRRSMVQKAYAGTMYIL